MAGKYDPLEAHLRQVPSTAQQVTLSFDQVSEIIGSALPASAYQRRQWWENQRDYTNRPQAKAWLSAGFEVETVQQHGKSGSVRFRRRQGL